MSSQSTTPPRTSDLTYLGSPTEDHHPYTLNPDGTYSVHPYYFYHPSYYPVHHQGDEANLGYCSAAVAPSMNDPQTPEAGTQHYVYQANAVHHPAQVSISSEWFYQSPSPADHDHPHPYSDPEWADGHQSQQILSEPRDKISHPHHGYFEEQAFYEDADQVSPVSDDSGYEHPHQSDYWNSQNRVSNAVTGPSFYDHQSRTESGWHSTAPMAVLRGELSSSPTFHDEPSPRSPRAEQRRGRPKSHPRTRSGSGSVSSGHSPASSHLPATTPQYSSPSNRPRRTPSPMGHLPYPEDVERAGLVPSSQHSRLHGNGISPHFVEYRADARIHQPQPHYPHPSSQDSNHSYAYSSSSPNSGPSERPQSQHSNSISLPPAPPPRSPPLVEDTPKKPLSLACFFCRKRKIACGSPPPGRRDRTCNQCARRSLKCVYPVASRRGMRTRGGDAPEIDGIFHPPVIATHPGGGSFR